MALCQQRRSSAPDTPAGYAVVDVARSTGRGGGVAVIFRQHLKSSAIPLPSCDTFEAICVRLTTASGPVVLLNIYRPGSVRPTARFYDELASVFEVLGAHSCPVVVGGDINVRVNDLDDTDARRLADLLATFDVVQHVKTPTHRGGGALDLVTSADYAPDEVSVDPSGMFFDHALVTCRLLASVGQATTAEPLVRGWRRVDRAVLCRVLEDSSLSQPVPDDADVDDLFVTYYDVLRDVADRLAPQHALRHPAGRLAPWFNANCRVVRRHCRRLERRYRRTRHVNDRRLWVDAVRSRLRLYREKEAYWLNRLSQSAHSTAQLWRLFTTMLGRDRDTSGATGHTADQFASFFAHKVRTCTACIRLSIDLAVVFSQVFDGRSAAYHHVVTNQILYIRSRADFPGP